MADDDKKKGGNSVASLLTGGIIGGLTELLFPGSGLLMKGLETLVYSTVIAPLARTVMGRKESGSEVYEDLPYDAAGYFSGRYLIPELVPALARYVI